MFLLNSLNDTDSDGLFHVSDCESTKGWVFLEDLNAHGFGGYQDNHGGITSLDEFGFLFQSLSSSSVDLALDLLEFACDMCGMAIEHWGISIADLTRVVQNDDLGQEVSSFSCGVVLGIRADVTSSDFLNGDVLDVETDVVAWNGFSQGLVMHLNGFDFSGKVGWGERDGHAWLEDTGLNSTHWDSSDTTDLVDVLKGKSQGLLSWSLGWGDGVQSLKEGGSLEPGEVGGFVDHIVAAPAGDGHEGDVDWVVADFLKEIAGFLLDFLESILGPVDGLLVHLVDADDHLLDTQSVSQKSVFSGLAFLGNTGFELSLGRGDHEQGAIGLRGTSDHVLDEISVAWGINDGEVEFGSLEFPKGDIDGDTSFSLSLELVEDPGVFEGTLSEILGFLLELLDGTLINTAALVDQVTGRGGLAGVDVSNNDEVNVTSFLGHF